jgi:hypothetical protein
MALLGDMGQGEGDDEQDDGMGPMVMQVDLTQDEAAAVERVGARARRAVNMLIICSLSNWALIVRLSYRHTCFVTRMRNWQQTSCLRMEMRTNRVVGCVLN